MSEFSRELMRLMDERGIGVRQLARAVYVNAGHVSNLRGGKARPSNKLTGLIDDYLKASGTLIAAWNRDQGTTRRNADDRMMAGVSPDATVALASVARADLADLPADAGGWEPGGSLAMLSGWGDVAEPPCPAFMSAGQLGAREIGHLEESVRLFRAWDHEHGGGFGRKAAVGQLAEVASFLARPHPAPLRKRLLGVASQLALTIASMSADSGQMPMAYRYLGLSLGAAREARDGSLGARAANAIARRVLDDCDPQAALSILRHARQSLRDLPGEMTSMLYTTEAWTCATIGDYDQMATCLEEAESLASEPGAIFGVAELAGISGACHETLAVRFPSPHRPARIAEAEARITEALRLRDPLYARSRVLDLAGLANVRLVQGEPEEAMRTASRALNAASGLRSDRATKRVHAVAIRALEAYPRLPAVAEFAELVRSRLPIA